MMGDEGAVRHLGTVVDELLLSLNIGERRGPVLMDLNVRVPHVTSHDL